MTETRGFPELKPVDAPPELDRFATAVRRLQIWPYRPTRTARCGTLRPRRSNVLALHSNRTWCPTDTPPRAGPPSCPASAIR